MFFVRSKRPFQYQESAVSMTGSRALREGHPSTPLPQQAALLSSMGPLGLFLHWTFLFCFWYSAVLVRKARELQNLSIPSRDESLQTRQYIVGLWIYQESQYHNPGFCVYRSGPMVQMKDELHKEIILWAKSQQVEDLGEAGGPKWFQRVHCSLLAVHSRQKGQLQVQSMRDMGL